MKTINGFPREDVLTPSMLRTLGAVLKGARGHRAVQVALGCAINHADKSLHRLRHRGVVAFEDGLYATLRPLVRFIPAEELR